MGAQSGDAVFQRTAEHARRPIGDFIHGVIALDIQRISIASVSVPEILTGARSEISALSR
jgi:hypothetical protein